MNWQAFWDEKAKQENPNAQVARVKAGAESGQKELEKISYYIKEKLILGEEEHLLDLCCGNGLLTQYLASFAGEITAIDFSLPHIEIARKRFSRPNITYLNGNAQHLSSITDKKFDKINLYFSFQYFDTFSVGEKIFKEMANALKENGKILIGDVPDQERIKVFYPNLLQRYRYYLARWRGRDQMGRFWSEEEMKAMARSAGLAIEKLTQPEDFLYQHYRSDYLCWKKA